MIKQSVYQARDGGRICTYTMPGIGVFDPIQKHDGVLVGAPSEGIIFPEGLPEENHALWAETVQDKLGENGVRVVVDLIKGDRNQVQARVIFPHGFGTINDNGQVSTGIISPDAKKYCSSMLPGDSEFDFNGANPGFISAGKFISGNIDRTDLSPKNHWVSLYNAFLQESGCAVSVRARIQSTEFPANHREELLDALPGFTIGM